LKNNLPTYFNATDFLILDILYNNYDCNISVISKIINSLHSYTSVRIKFLCKQDLLIKRDIGRKSFIILSLNGKKLTELIHEVNKLYKNGQS
jgi:predicted transcriptional regulator